MLDNVILWSSLTSAAVAQAAKVVVASFVARKWSPERISATGGMPSSHAAIVSALATSCGMLEGVDSTSFAISVVLGLIVLYDATGIRRAAGHHAEVLNELLEEFGHLFDEENSPRALKTLLGHTYPQVFLGALLGGIVAYIVTKGAGG